MASKKNAEPVVELKSILFTTVDGKEHRVDVPKGAKLTFGPAVPYAPKTQQAVYMASHAQGYALRIYDGTMLLACFTGVAEFRDLSITKATVVVRESGKTVWKSDESGFSVSTEGTRQRSMVPDEAVKLLNT